METYLRPSMFLKAVIDDPASLSITPEQSIVHSAAYRTKNITEEPTSQTAPSVQLWPWKRGRAQIWDILMFEWWRCAWKFRSLSDHHVGQAHSCAQVQVCLISFSAGWMNQSFPNCFDFANPWVYSPLLWWVAALTRMDRVVDLSRFTHDLPISSSVCVAALCPFYRFIHYSLFPSSLR